MKKMNVLAAVVAVLAAASVAKAQVDFDGALGLSNSAEANKQPLKEFIAATLDNSTAIPLAIPGREYFVNSEKPQNDPVIFLRSKQVFLKQLLMQRIAFETKGDLLDVLKADATIVLFDSHSVYLASDKFDVFATFSDTEFKSVAINSNNSKGMCHTVIKYGKRCAWWANLVCTAWELYEIYEEICDGDNDGGNSNSGPSGGGAHGPHGNPLEYRHI